MPTHMTKHFTRPSRNAQAVPRDMHQEARTKLVAGEALLRSLGDFPPFPPVVGEGMIRRLTSRDTTTPRHPNPSRYTPTLHATFEVLRPAGVWLITADHYRLPARSGLDAQRRIVPAPGSSGPGAVQRLTKSRRGSSPCRVLRRASTRGPAGRGQGRANHTRPPSPRPAAPA